MFYLRHLLHVRKSLRIKFLLVSYTLKKARSIYTEYCMACHGVNGDGKGVAAKGLKYHQETLRQGL